MKHTLAHTHAEDNNLVSAIVGYIGHLLTIEFVVICGGMVTYRQELQKCVRRVGAGELESAALPPSQPLWWQPKTDGHLKSAARAQRVRKWRRMSNNYPRRRLGNDLTLARWTRLCVG